MRLRNTQGKSRREPDLTGLINIVFLILIFFIVAGTLRPFTARDIELAKTAPEKPRVATPTRLVVDANGQLRYVGNIINQDELTERLRTLEATSKTRPFIVVADARFSARQLMVLVRAIRSTGIENVAVLTEKDRNR
ncbi:MAG: biopolymer transporter ExbD [Pseudomonadota bacterium]